jgi:predicted dehydrogenase
MANDANAKLGAICDIYPDKIDAAKTNIPGAADVKAYKDLNELLARPDIDAVLIATPVYLHPVHFEAAVKAGKHIYCEKPAGADVAGVKRLLAAAAKSDPSKTIQFGFQQRFSPEYLKAEQILRTGKIGDMKMMMSYWVLGDTPPKEAPANTHGYSPEEFKIRHWGNYRETSGGPRSSSRIATASMSSTGSRKGIPSAPSERAGCAIPILVTPGPQITTTSRITTRTAWKAG